MGARHGTTRLSRERLDYVIFEITCKSNSNFLFRRQLLITPRCGDDLHCILTLSRCKMTDHWKSTPSYWCKFCSIYVRDSSLERKNHEASGKHQNNIQRSLRDLQRGKEREGRDKQRAKDEVARLNGLVAGPKSASPSNAAGGTRATGAPSAINSSLSAAASRKAQAEQLAAMGIDLPEDLKREVTGVGGWQTVSTRVIQDRSVKEEEDSKDFADLSRGVHKRKVEDDEEEHGDDSVARTKAWGSRMKVYPGAQATDDGEDLDALLSGVKKKQLEVKKEEEHSVKREEPVEDEKPITDIPDIDAPAAPVKQEEGDAAVAPIVFKKRKMKK